ncbi:MAG: hypothetical protein NVSMB47_17860 [Polyangiales bacterium]
MLIPDAASDDRWSRERYQLLGHEPRSICLAPVKHGQRYLGVLEIADHLDGSPLGDNELHAVTYIAEQFGEFVADRGVKLKSGDSGQFPHVDLERRR